MKRKATEPNPKDPLQIRSPSQRGFHGVLRSSVSQFPITTPSRTTDISCKKRVKSSGLDDEDRRRPRCEFADNAKTSEYAFFRKLKEDANHKYHSCSLHKEAYQTKNSKSRDCSRERINTGQSKSEDTRSLLLNKNAILGNFDKFLPTLGGASKNSELNMKRDCATPLEDVHRKQNDMVEEYKNASRPKGKRLTHFEETETQYKHANLFDRKRQKLFQWVRETSLPEIHELYSKGYNIVSVLLSRLIPKSNENNNFEDPKLMQVETSGKYMPLPPCDSDIHFRKLQWTPTRNFMEIEDGPYLGDTTLSCWSKRSRERLFCSDSPTSDTYKNHLQCRIGESDFEILGGSPNSCAKGDSNSVVPFQKYGWVTSDHLKELDVFSQPNEYLVGRELCVPMLGWDFDSTNEERNSSVLSRYGAEHTSAPSANYKSHDVVRHFLEDKEDLRSDFHQIPLTLSSIPDCINLAEDCINDRAWEGDTTFFSLQNDHWFTSKISNEGHHYSNIESLLSTGLDSNLGWKYLWLRGSSGEHYSPTWHALQFPGEEGISSSLVSYNNDERCLNDSNHTRTLTSFIEDNGSIHDSSAFCLQIPLDREKAWPLLLDRPSWDENEREMNYDDGDGDVNYV